MGGIKLHSLFGIETSFLSFLHIATTKVHDINIMDIIPYETGGFCVADKGYTDFLGLHRMHANGSFFAIRAKENLQFRRMYSNVTDKTTGILIDQIRMLVIKYSRTE